MTRHKHLKELVRSRVQKTGESYTTARRHVLRKADTAAESGSARWHLPGNVPATTALRVILTAAGVRDPRTGAPLSEALLFGIAGGIGIGIAAFRYEKADFSSFYIAGRHLWQDDVAYLKAALLRFGTKPTIRETAGAKSAEKQLRQALAEGAPAIAWVDMAHLPHCALPAQFSGGGYHLVTVYSIDDQRGLALIGDKTDKPIEIALADLATARGRIKSFKNRLLSIGPVQSPEDLVGPVRAGLKACCGGFSGKPVKGPAIWSSLKSLKRWAERLFGSRDKESWELIFPRGHLLAQGLMSVHDFIENYHTGGGLCRPLFSESLAEAAEFPGLAALRPVAARYAELGTSWSDLADSALPENVAAFREARRQCALRAELLAEGNLANVAQVKAVWARLAELRQAARENFPLSASECAVLLASLQKKVTAIYEAEVAAHSALSQAIA